MNAQNHLVISVLLFSAKGRINRRTYWLASLFTWTSFYVLFNAIEYLVSYNATLIIYPVLYWALACTAIKRLHDTGLSGWWLLLILVPLFGPLALFFLLGFRKGRKAVNKYGLRPNAASNYFENPAAESIRHLKSGEKIVNDVSQLNPVLVSRVVVPETVEELQAIVAGSPNHLSVGGGRFSMGGQTASSYSSHIDMRKLNRILAFDPDKKLIKAEAGIRWCDIQQHIDSHNLSVKVMQSYANFTVGGSVSVNCHGRYTGYGAVIMTVRSMDIVLASGELMTVSRTQRPELFEAVAGCYNAVAIIAAVELELADNVPVELRWKLLTRKEYPGYFAAAVRDDRSIVFHNGDLYPPDFKKIRAVSWVKTAKKPTQKSRLMNLSANYPVERFFIRSFSRNNFAKWRRQHLVDPLLYSRKKIHWRNYEAGYDVAELEPSSRQYSSYIQQEFFVPVAQFEAFAEKMSEIFRLYGINVINVSIRHALPNSESLLSWCDREVFAFVIWYKQSSSEKGKNKAAIWTRELTEAALSCGGTYYLPYQPHATAEQFHRAFPRANQLFRLKQQLDPEYKFRNSLWEKYYQPKNDYSNE